MVFSELPEEIRNWITSSDVKTSINNINDAYKIKDVFLLPQIVSEVAVGNVKMNQLPTIIHKELGIDPKLSADISKEVVSKIFDPIATQLAKINISLNMSGGGTAPSKDGQPTVSPKPEVTTAKEAPFILHKEDEAANAQTGPNPIDVSAMRPMFYQAPNTPGASGLAMRINLYGHVWS